MWGQCHSGGGAVGLGRSKAQGADTGAGGLGGAGVWEAAVEDEKGGSGEQVEEVATLCQWGGWTDGVMAGEPDWCRRSEGVGAGRWGGSRVQSRRMH